MFDIPCKKCLIQAVCRERCNKFNKYSFVPVRLKTVGTGLLVGGAFSSIASSYRDDLTFVILFLICAISGIFFMVIGLMKEKKYYRIADELITYESAIFRKYGVKFPANRRAR